MHRLLEEAWPLPGAVLCSSLFHHPLPQSIKKRCVRYLCSSPLCYSKWLSPFQTAHHASATFPDMQHVLSTKKKGSMLSVAACWPFPPWSVNNAGLGDTVDSEPKNVFYSSDLGSRWKSPRVNRKTPHQSTAAPPPSCPDTEDSQEKCKLWGWKDDWQKCGLPLALTPQNNNSANK